MIDAINKVNKRIKNLELIIKEINGELGKIKTNNMEDRIAKIELEGQILLLEDKLKELFSKKAMYLKSLLFWLSKN